MSITHKRDRIRITLVLIGMLDLSTNKAGSYLNDGPSKNRLCKINYLNKEMKSTMEKLEFNVSDLLVHDLYHLDHHDEVHPCLFHELDLNLKNTIYQWIFTEHQ